MPFANTRAVAAVGPERQDLVEERRRRGGPWSLPSVRPTSTPTYRRPLAPKPMPLKPSNFLRRGVERLAEVNFVPFQPLHAISRQLGRPGGEHPAADVELVVVPGQAGHELDRAGDLDARRRSSARRPPPLGGPRALGVPPSPDEHPAVRRRRTTSASSARTRRAGPCGRWSRGGGGGGAGARADGRRPQRESSGGGQASHRDYAFGHDYS